MRKKKEEKKKVMLCGQLICPVTVSYTQMTLPTTPYV